MGCYVSSPITNFTKANTKEELINCYSNEINRLNIIKQELKKDNPTPEEQNKINILDKIFIEHHKVIHLLVLGCKNEDVAKFKFFLFDYFKTTETWKLNELEENYVKITNFCKDNNILVNFTSNY